MLHFLSQSLGQWDFVVTRDRQDSFHLVDKNNLSCFGTNDEYCAVRNGKLDLNAKTCQCLCTSNASTFGVLAGNWKCLNDIRKISSKY